MSWDLIFQHLFIVLAASLLSIAVGLPLGIWAYVSKTARPVILRIVDLLQTIPSLALLGIIMVVLDPGKLTVITGITLYSLLPIVRNTCLGLQEVDPGVKEAARGMGMSKPYRVLMVEFPLAFPTVFTGIRIAPAYLEQPTQQVPYTMELGAYTEDLKRLKLPLPPQARRMPGGTYLSSFLEAETDGTLRGGQLQPVLDYAAAHHYRFCPEQGAFLYCLNGGEEALQLVFCFQVRVEPENG